MSRSADEVFRELLDVRAQLDRLPADAPERVELELRRGVLHREAAELDPDRRTRLEQQAAQASRRVEEVEKMRLDGANMAGLVGIGGGMDPEIIKFVNDAIDENHDLDGLRAELAAIREQLPDDEE